MLDPTKARLLDAAGEEFAEKGFEGATVRSICDRARVNLASVNYHFGDKELLYEQAVLEAHRCGNEMPPDVMADGPPAELLRRYIHFFLTNVVALRDSTWHHRLMLREMVSPTRASEILVNEAIRPRFEHLSGILRRICPEADDRRIHALGFSVVGQCLHYKLTKSISERIVGPEAFARLDLDFLTDHITHFTLAALGVAPPFDEAGEMAEEIPETGKGGAR
ncbi:CerR family C-terminal domain-containing protein [Tundrisphaera lichenicola]|uniref:CerR family C-terminal domain-containing protein n=1 Tax=Tundrisphaera lichenicola TaxID=2029860 RepID=UPI003EBCBF6C